MSDNISIYRERVNTLLVVLTGDSRTSVRKIERTSLSDRWKADGVVYDEHDRMHSFSVLVDRIEASGEFLLTREDTATVIGSKIATNLINIVEGISQPYPLPMLSENKALNFYLMSYLFQDNSQEFNLKINNPESGTSAYIHTVVDIEDSIISLRFLKVQSSKAVYPHDVLLANSQLMGYKIHFSMGKYSLVSEFSHKIFILEEKEVDLFYNLSTVIDPNQALKFVKYMVLKRSGEVVV